VIRETFSTLPSFKRMQFKPGLNIILADKVTQDTGKTRNRAGKTSFVELVHFLTGGADHPKDSIFRKPALADHTFGMVLDVAGSQLRVERNGKGFGKLSVEGEPKGLLAKGGPRHWSVKSADWEDWLGHSFFQIPRDFDEKWGPTFRQLFAYFVRRQHSQAFGDPFKNSGPQQIGDQQVAMLYLLGLDWEAARQWIFVREDERTIKELRKVVGVHGLSDLIGTTATLRSKLVMAEDKLRKLNENVGSFRVLESYRDLEQEADKITLRMSELEDGRVLNRLLLSRARQAMSEDLASAPTNLEQVYAEAGLAFPDKVLRRFEEVKEFHESVLSNRKRYLERQVLETEAALHASESELKGLDARRATIMDTLSKGGALDQYKKLQQEIGRHEADAQVLRIKFEAAEQLEGKTTEFEQRRNALLQRLRASFKEQDKTIRHAILRFEELSKALYDDAGIFKLAESTNGPTFDVSIHGKDSLGITHMQIFCVDMMLMTLARDRGWGMNLLIHDSQLFDGVDPRQTASALRLGAELASKFGFQYIVTLNSDVLAAAGQAGFNANPHVVEPRLTDAIETGGLFGFRFD
jgi:uncharacterized protein YydD (DUF2326 family)